MLLMKKLLCAITFVALFASCGQKEGPNSDDNLPSGDVKLEFYPLKPDSPAVHAEGGECTISFSVNRNWKASADSWMTLSATSGKAGEVALIVTTSENKGSKRTGEIVISTKDYSEKISITQYPAIVSMEPRSKRNLKWDFSMSYSNNTFNNIYAQVSKPQTNMYQTVNASDMAGASTVVSENKLNETWFLRWDTPADGGVSRSIPFSVVFNTLHTDFSRIEGYEDYDTDSDLYKTYTGADVFQNQYYVNPSNANIKKQADKLWADAKGDIITFARKASTWTAENIPYTRMNTGLHPVQDILDNGGDCGNQASVFISLLRAKGIPARHVVLCRVGSAHVRAEFYLAGYGWIPADPNGEQSAPSLDWFGHVDNDADALVVSLGICNEYNIPAIGLFNCLLGQGLCGLWYNWRGETSYDLSFALVEFEPYLEDMGAAKERDDVFASVCYCPIIDLEHADMAYEWMYGNTDSRQGLPDEQKTVSEELAGQFPEYLAALNCASLTVHC